MIESWDLAKTTEGVRARGEIDLAAAEEFTDQLCATARASTQRSFVVDLSGVTFMDSTGLHALDAVAETCPRLDILIRTSPQVFRVLELVGFVATPWPNVVIVPPDEGAR